MNKIYKIVWSKVKHCYVVTSELAKRQTKGCGARSLRMAAVTMGVAAALLGGIGKSIAHAAVISDAANPVSSANPAGSILELIKAEEGPGYAVYGINPLTHPTDKNLTITGSTNAEVSQNYGFVGTYTLGNAEGGTVNLSAGTVGALMGGGAVNTFNAIGNTVNVTGGTVYLGVYGGFSDKQDAIGNTVEISGTDTKVECHVVPGHEEAECVVGGSAGNNASKNNVIINGGLIEGKVYGADVENGMAGGTSEDDANKVIISGGKVTGDVYGGYSNKNVAKFNSVTIDEEVGKEVKVTGNLYGGFSNSSNAINNKVTVNGGEVTDTVYGGYATSSNGYVSGNSVIISDGTVSTRTKTNSSQRHVYGGYSQNGMAGGDTKEEGNIVTITGGTVYSTTVFGGISFASSSDGYAKNNSLNIRGGTISGDVGGGYSQFIGATDNSVIIGGDKEEISIAGSVMGGSSNDGISEKNTVTVGNGTAKVTVSGTVSGGTSIKKSVEGNIVTIGSGSCATSVNQAVFGGGSNGSFADSNVVTIGGGTGTTVVKGDVYGGYSTGSDSAANTNSNSVTIGGGTGTTEVSGAVHGGSTANGATSGNGVTISGSKTTVNITGNNIGVHGVYGGHSSGSGTVSKNTVTISDGATVNSYEVYGGYSENGDAGGTSEGEGNTLTVTDSTVSGFVMGGRSKYGNANYNSATVYNSLLTSSVDNKFDQGGRAGVSNVGYGTANYNTVTINGSMITATGSTNYASVYGGRSTYGKADFNTVTITGTTITTLGANTAVSIYGGASDNKTTACNDNTVNLLGTSVIDGKGSTNIYGSNETAGTGNELHIGGVKGSTATGSDNIWTNNSSKGTNAVSGVYNFDKIALHDVAWNTSVPALHAGTVSNVNALDITNLKIYDGTTEKTEFKVGDSMSLLAADSSDLSGIKLKYNDGAAVAIGDGIDVVTGEAFTDTPSGGVTVLGTGGRKVSLADENKTIKYSYAVKGTGITLGNVEFVKDGTARTLSDVTFDGDSTVDASKLTFTNTVSGLLAKNDSMTLVTGATGITGNKLTVPDDGKVAFQYTEEASGIAIEGKATGIVSAADNAVKYTIDGFVLDKADLSGWNGNTSVATADWSGSMGVDVATGSFTASPDVDPEHPFTIMTAADASFYNDRITGDRQLGYNLNDTTAASDFSGDADKGVTFAGKYAKGVRASEDHKTLEFAAETTKYVTAIELGTIDADSSKIRNMDGKDYDFTYVTTVDATNLKISNPEDLKKNQAVNLLSKAKNLAAGLAVTKSEHSQDLAVTHDGSGIKFSGSLSGTVSTTAEAVQYTLNGRQVQTIDLKGWNGTLFNEDLSDWTPSAGATIATDGMNAPAGLAPGASVTIMQDASGDDFFDGMEVTGGLRWQGAGPLEDTAVNGVSVAGQTTGGGVKVTDDKNKVVYQQSKNTVDKITLNQITFANGETARSFGNMYDMTAAEVETGTAADLFTEASYAAMKTGNSMVLVDAENAIKDDANHTLKAFTKKEYNYDFSNKAADHLTIAGKRTDTLEQDAAQTKLVYTVGEQNAEKATLAGSLVWIDDSTYYKNTIGDTGKHAYTFSDTTDIDVSGVKFFTTENKDPLAGKTQAMTLIAKAGDGDKVKGTITGTPSFEVTMNLANTKLEADGQGTAAIVNDDLKYTVTGVALKTVTVNSVGETADKVPDNWTLAAGATVETEDMTVPGLSAGTTKVIIEKDSGADFFNGITINGKNKWSEGGDLAADPEATGVSVTGTQTGGGVKVNETNKNQLIYEASKKDVKSLKLEGITFANGKTVREFDASYDLTAAVIIAGTADTLFTEESCKIMEAGNSMKLVDATNAIKDGDGHALVKFADQNYEIAFEDTDADKGITFAGKHTDILNQDNEQTMLTYTVGAKNVDSATVTGEIAWQDGGTYYTNEKYTFTGDSKTDISGVTFTADSDPLNKSMTLISNAAGSITGTPDFKVSLANTTLEATAAGDATTAGGNLGFKVTGVTLDSVEVNGTGGDAIPDGWTVNAEGVAVDTQNMDVPGDVAAGEEKTILTSNNANTFTDDKISGDNKYGFNPNRVSEQDETQGAVTITGKQDKGVKASEDGKKLVYAMGKKDIATVTLGSVTWQKDGELLDASGDEYNYGDAAYSKDGFAMSYGEGVEKTLAADDSMTLLKANETLADMAAEESRIDYTGTPAEGVTMNATVAGNLEAKGGKVTYTVTENKASKLTFGNVTWLEDGSLMTRPANITFAGADVDTASINFYNIEELEANKQMTLVSDFGDTVGTVTGSKYKVGTGLEGEGAASLSGSDLIFTAKTGVENLAAQEQTHNTVMAMEAGMAMLTAGNDFVGKAVEGLADMENRGEDGASTFASVGGSGSRYETGSHVNTNTWNAIVAVGAKKAMDKGALEYGVFGEYGKGNYKLHSATGYGDGDAHYAGGGILAKWVNNHDVYTEASFRLGRMSDSAKDILRGGGNSYGYDVHANYCGAHVGIGKMFKYEGGRELDVYGKFFYTKRDGVAYSAGGSDYSLDSVASSVLRVGARYGTTDKLWNWYGGLAYEYEFDGEATGTVNGTAVRSASVKGSSVRGELGMKMSASKDNPWQANISIYGYGGKHRGFGGNVSVAYLF